MSLSDYNIFVKKQVCNAPNYIQFRLTIVGLKINAILLYLLQIISQRKRLISNLTVDNVICFIISITSSTPLVMQLCKCLLDIPFYQQTVWL